MPSMITAIFSSIKVMMINNISVVLIDFKARLRGYLTKNVT